MIIWQDIKSFLGFLLKILWILFIVGLGIIAYLCGYVMFDDATRVYQASPTSNVPCALVVAAVMVIWEAALRHDGLALRSNPFLKWGLKEMTVGFLLWATGEVMAFLQMYRLTLREAYRVEDVQAACQLLGTCILILWLYGVLCRIFWGRTP